jgi:hypothetical protein
MNYNQACERAARLARKNGRWYGVFLEDADWGEYAVGNEEDADTWFLGSSPVAAFDAEGMLSDA